MPHSLIKIHITPIYALGFPLQKYGRRCSHDFCVVSRLVSDFHSWSSHKRIVPKFSIVSSTLAVWNFCHPFDFNSNWQLNWDNNLMGRWCGAKWVNSSCDEKARLKNCNLIVRWKMSSRSLGNWVFSHAIPPYWLTQFILLHCIASFPALLVFANRGFFQSKPMQKFIAMLIKVTTLLLAWSVFASPILSDTVLFLESRSPFLAT